LVAASCAKANAGAKPGVLFMHLAYRFSLSHSNPLLLGRCVPVEVDLGTSMQRLSVPSNPIVISRRYYVVES
jgi:hypothetical protein